jgi:hypothetical protein
MEGKRAGKAVAWAGDAGRRAQTCARPPYFRISCNADAEVVGSSPRLAGLLRPLVSRGGLRIHLLGVRLARVPAIPVRRPRRRSGPRDDADAGDAIATPESGLCRRF